jgi:hypothetical protein
MSCEKCNTVLARRATDSPVIDGQGNWLESYDEEDERADYLMVCDCGAKIEFQSPEDVQQYKTPDAAPEPKGRPVLRLT